MLKCLLVGIGGMIGSICRYLISLIPVREPFLFPVKILFINLTGCFVVGMITALAEKNPIIDSRIILFLKIGICGGFTAFSAFALETAELMKNGHAGMAILYIIVSVLAGVLVIFGADRIITSIS